MATRAEPVHLRALPGGADLERLLAEAERPAPEELPGAEEPAEPEEPAAASPAQPKATTSAAHAPASAATPTLAPMISGAPPRVASGRYRVDEDLKPGLPGRQLAWTAWSALALAVASAGGLLASHPAVVVAVALALGAWASRPRQILRGAGVAMATVGAVLLVGLLEGQAGSATLLSGAQVLTAGAVAGLGASFLDKPAADRWRRVQGGLGGAAGAGLGWWAATTLVGPPGEGALTGALQGAALGLLGSQALLAGAMQWKATDRIPSPGRIRAALSPAYQPPCLRAWQLDQGFEKQAPDPDTRDGLGEVAAWIFRLQWTHMALDREIAALEGEGLGRRRDALDERAASAADEFTRDRLQATARHLDQLARHRDTLTLERERTSALAEYASAYLEEARAGLALARVLPGEHVPDRLGDVLGRLRSHAAASDARRRTARELGELA